MISKSKIRSYCFHNNIIIKNIKLIEENCRSVKIVGDFKMDDEEVELLEIDLSEFSTKEDCDKS